MKKTLRILSMFMIVLMVVSISSTVFATSTTTKIDTSIIDGMTGNADIGTAGTTIGNIGNTILTIVTTVGMVLAVVLVAILGIKYMMGSSEENAEYKKSMMPYLVGAVLVFGASAIGKAVVGFGTSIVG